MSSWLSTEKFAEKLSLSVCLCNTEYFSPFGVLKLLQIAVGITFFSLIFLDCFLGHCWTKTASDLKLRIYLTMVPAFCSLSSLLFFLLHLICPIALFEKSKSLRFIEILYSLLALALYFIARYYCANYYGGPEKLEGRWIPITVAVWANVVLYMVDAFVVIGVKARCGRNGLLMKQYMAVPQVT